MMNGGMRIAHNNAVIKTAPGIEKTGRGMQISTENLAGFTINW